jgi:DNA modification methylase
VTTTQDIIIGNALDVIPTLSDNSIDCVVTSPPYWQLRDFGHPDQIGHEQTPLLFIDALVSVFQKVRPKLKDSGSLFINLADTYASSSKGDNRTAESYSGHLHPKALKSSLFKSRKISPDVPMGCLCMIPERFAWAMIENGWILKNKIIWHKTNPMPESVSNRLSKTYEFIFHFVKSTDYYYDLDAIRKPLAASSITRISQDIENQSGSSRGYQAGYKPNSPMKAVCNPMGKNPGDVISFDDELCTDVNLLIQKWKQMHPDDWDKPCDVLDISSTPYSKAHFATFPLSIVELCVKAGSSEMGCCPVCGAPLKRIVVKHFIPQSDVSPSILAKGSLKGFDPSCGWGDTPRGSSVVSTIGWDISCSCDAGDPIPSVVLDPFAGSGTVGEFCRHNNRNSILIELNEDYKPLIDDRIIASIPPLGVYDGC